jgi:hypothetical protein
MNIDRRPPALPDLTGYKILLAEDNETNQLVASEMLGAMGAQVALAADGAEALGDAVLSSARADIRAMDAPMLASVSDPARGALRADPTARTEHVAPDILRALIGAVGRERMDELLGKVIHDIGVAGDTCARAAPAGDMLGLRGATHVLMSVSGTVGAVRLQRMAERLNDLAHGELAAEAEFYAAALLTEADQVILTLLREKERN